MGRNYSNKYRTKKSRKRRKILFVVEMIILAALTLVLLAAIWATGKFSLIKHTELDRTKLRTSSEANAGKTKTADGTYVEQPTATPAPENQMTGIDVIALVGIDARYAEDGKNSDTMIIACINHNTKNIKLVSIYRDTLMNIGEDYYGTPDTYQKANAAYNLGGPEQFLSMLNLNLDLNITEYATVNFQALAKTIDLLGGLDIELTREECVHVNNYNYETSEVCGVPYEAIDIPDQSVFDGAMVLPFHLNGTQSVSYARIRYGQGNDYRRASRQRHVLALIKEKAAQADIGTLNGLLDAVLPYVETNMSNTKLVSLITSIMGYSMTTEDQAAFPFVHLVPPESEYIVPVNLTYNVQTLHQFLFPGEYYEVPWTVEDYNYTIEQMYGYDASYIEYAQNVEYYEDIPDPTDEEKEQLAREVQGE